MNRFKKWLKIKIYKFYDGPDKIHSWGSLSSWIKGTTPTQVMRTFTTSSEYMLPPQKLLKALYLLHRDKKRV